MVITCSKCNTTYNIDASKIPVPGVMATCKKCGSKFRVQRGSTPKPMPEAPIPVIVPVSAREKEMGLKPLGGLTNSLRVLLFINIAVTVVAIIAGIYEFHTYMNLPPGFDLEETLLPVDVVTALLGLVQIVIFIILGITFLRWIHRTNKNLGAVSGQPMRFTPGWSVGWYFIPIANLFKPYQAMKEIWEVSHKYQSGTSSTLGLWWALWLITTFIDEFVFKSIMGAESATEYGTSSLIYIVSYGIDIMLDIAALMLVTQIGNAYTKNYSQRRTSTGGHTTAQRPVQPDRSKSPTLQPS